MKKNISKLTSITLGITTVSSIALALHFNSLNEDLEQSQYKLNAKYREVLVENEELRDKNLILFDETKKSSGLLEQSNMEIERLTTETDKLQHQVDHFRKEVSTLEKKLKSTPY